MLTSPKAVLVTKLRTGDHKAQFLNDAVIGKWCERRDVIYISSEYKSEMVTVENKRILLKEKSLSIMRYNKYMIGIDQDQDQITHCCSKLYVDIKNWGFNVLTNAYLPCRKYSNLPNFPFYDFRLVVIQLLAEKKVNRKNFKTFPIQNRHHR